MKNVVLIFMVLSSLGILAQTNFEKGMEKGLDLWKAGNNAEAINLFERIAAAEKENWLPSYYAAKIRVINSFKIKDITELKSTLDKAQDYINQSKANSPENAEIMALEALYYTSWVVYDGAKYGMMYAAKIGEIYNEAHLLDPKNPRVLLSKTEWDMGSARYFGKSVAPYCKDLDRAIELFKSENITEPFVPKGGLDNALRAKEENCNS